MWKSPALAELARESGSSVSLPEKTRCKLGRDPSWDLGKIQMVDSFETGLEPPCARPYSRHLLYQI